MKLLSCHIENFGKFQQFDYEFHDGLNIIEENNGWGKTTLAAFVKAMFFGMEYKRGKAINDRKRYYPWNNQKFGGYLVFEYQEATYRIERYFGQRDKDDSFKLYNATTNLPSDVFGANLGEEIWQIDRDSFEKTAFITLNDTGLFSDLIAAKLSDFDEGEVDLDGASDAIARLEQALKNLDSSRGNKGQVQQLGQTIADLKHDYKKAWAAQRQIDQLEVKIKEEQAKLAANREGQAQLDQERESFRLVDQQAQYAQLCHEYEIEKAVYTTLVNQFEGETYSFEEIETKLSEVAHDVRNYYNQVTLANQSQLELADQNRLVELEVIFDAGLPKMEMIDECEEDIVELNNLRRDIKAYVNSQEQLDLLERWQNRYGHLEVTGAMIDQYIRDFERVTKIDRRIVDINYDIDKNTTLNQDQPGNSSKWLYGVAAILIIAGLGLMAFNQTLGLVGFGLGLLVLVGAIIVMIKARPDQAKPHHHQEQFTTTRELEAERINLAQERQVLEERYLEFLDAIGLDHDYVPIALTTAKAELDDFHQLEAEIKLNNEEYAKTAQVISELDDKVKGYLSRYLVIEASSDYLGIVRQLRQSLLDFQTLAQRNQNYVLASQSAKELQGKLTAYFTKFYPVEATQFDALVAKINVDFNDYKNSETRYRQLEYKKTEFESSHDMAALANFSFDEEGKQEQKTMLSLRQEAVDQELSTIQTTIANYRRDIVEYAKDSDLLEDLESQIENQETKLVELKHLTKLVKIAAATMQAARDDIQARYLGDVTVSFKKYLDLLSAISFEKYQVDTNLNVHLESGGELHDASELSTGMQDLVQVCLRMALVDAIFKDVDRPVLILDDPFVNLDNVRLEKALALLKLIAQDYQIVYFICHPSRNLNDR